VVNDCFNLLAISMMKKNKTREIPHFSSSYFRSFIRRNIHQIIFNNRWSTEKNLQIEFFGIECNIYIQMIVHYLNMIQVKLPDKNLYQSMILSSSRLVYSIISSSSTSYISSFTQST
jgi:hypothetical protein